MHVQSCCFANLNLFLFWRSRGRRRCWILRSLFFFLTVTEKVWESESTDASDDEPQIIIKPPVSYEKRPSPVKKTGAKKTHSDMKGKGVKQSSLTSFFKKS